MDRNTITGLVLIGVIMSAFMIFNKPSEEEIAKQKEEQQKKELAAKQKEKEKKTAKAEKDSTIVLGENWVPKMVDGAPAPADSGYIVYQDTITEKDTTILLASVPAQTNETPEESTKEEVEIVNGELIQLENDKLIVNFNTKGGQVASVRLKGYETYDNFAKKDNEITPLLLFEDGDATNGLILPLKSGSVNTTDKLFEVKKQTDNSISFAWTKGKQEVIFTYTLTPDQFDLQYDIELNGFNGEVSPQNVMLAWDVAYAKTERLLSEQRRVSTVCFDYKKEGFSYLSEVTEDEEEAEDNLNWIAYKQSYFSSFMRPANGFSKEGSEFSIKNYEEGDDKYETNVKDYSSKLNLNLKSVDGGKASINWYFGPNDFKTLKSYDEGYDHILNYGWGLFRWINLYAVQPLFNLLKSSGASVGIVILLLTFLIKFLLMPIQWKMYTSSAKMRILKPEIEEINAKYPNKEDAMKKQMETMSLYRESGASPLAGCVPMLIQMPILLAVFRFFPSTFALRQQSFLWAEDLSSYDSIYNFGFSVPLYGDHISLFTLLMAATTLIYTVINSGNMQQPQQPGMPNMKVIMYFFPIMMIFFFNNYSSGLSYYYFISTLSSILIMLMIKRFFVDEEKLKAKMATRKATASAKPAKGKSKFQERLEQMQKAQMEQMKNKKK